MTIVMNIGMDGSIVIGIHRNVELGRLINAIIISYFV